MSRRRWRGPQRGEANRDNRRIAHEVNARGAAWEGQLSVKHAEYSRLGLARVLKCGPPMRFSRTAQGALTASPSGVGPPDYGGVLRAGRAVAFEAKRTKKARWPLCMLEEHQAEGLREVHALGGLAFVALLMDRAGAPPRAWVLPWETLGPRWDAWKEAARLALFRRAGGRSASAPPGTASLSHDDCDDLGFRMPSLGDWLGALGLNNDCDDEVTRCCP